jgi:uncharacterized membrane protein
MEKGSKMQSYFWQYLVAIVVFLILDFIWLSTAGRSIYVSELGGLLRDRPDFVVAFGFYLIFVAGLVGFVIHPAQIADNLSQAILMGAFFGLVSYGTYDLTNLSTIKGFTPLIATVDLAWGTFLSACVSGVTFSLIRYFKLG